MTAALVLDCVLRYGPSVLPLIQQLAELVKSGKTDVTAEDIAELIAYGKKTSADYLREAGVQGSERAS